jgi:hypothetical protein
MVSRYVTVLAGIVCAVAVGGSLAACSSPTPVSSRSAVRMARAARPASTALAWAAISADVGADVYFTGDVVTVDAVTEADFSDWLRLGSMTVRFADGTTASVSQSCMGSPAVVPDQAGPGRTGLTVSHVYTEAGLLTARVTAASVCGHARHVDLSDATSTVQVLSTAPPGSASWPGCTQNQIQIAASSSGVAAGHMGVLFTLQNVSSVSCRLFGYPGLELLGPGGTRLPTTVVRGGSYLFPSIAPHWVALPPGTFAAFDVEYGDVPSETGPSETCPTASGAEVYVPGSYDFSVVAVSMAPCGGEVVVSPVVPGRSWVGFG